MTGISLRTHIIFSSIFPDFKLLKGYILALHTSCQNGICGPQWIAHQFLLFYWLVFYQGNGDLWVAFVIVCAIILSCVGIALSSWLKAQTMVLKRDNPYSRPFFESGRMWLVTGMPQQELPSSMELVLCSDASHIRIDILTTISFQEEIKLLYS